MPDPDKLKPKCELCHDKKGEPEAFALRARCHMTAPLQATYDARTGVLTLRCYIRECSREIASFKVEARLGRAPVETN